MTKQLTSNDKLHAEERQNLEK